MISSDFLGVRMTGTLDACIMVVLRLAADKKCINGDEILCIYAKRMMKFHINYESLLSCKCLKSPYLPLHFPNWTKKVFVMINSLFN